MHANGASRKIRGAMSPEGGRRVRMVPHGPQFLFVLTSCVIYVVFVKIHIAGFQNQQGKYNEAHALIIQ